MNIQKRAAKMITNKYSTLSEIPNGHYEGYLWYSDSDSPEMVQSKVEFKDGDNPFIVEGMLWDESNKTSVMIRHTGKYFITSYDLKGHDGFVVKNYLPHKLPDIKHVSFAQIWEDEPDELCEGFTGQKLTAVVFCGFDKKTEE